MNFRDAYQDDLETTFFDLDDFASEHMIDGKPMVVVLETVDFQEAKAVHGARKSAMNPKENAINRESFALYIKDSDAARKKYTVNARIQVDGQDMFIYDVKQMEGIRRLVVGKHMV